LEYSNAMEQFEKVLKKQPENSEAFFYSACVYRRSGNWGMAMERFRKAAELDPNTFEYAFDAALTFDLLRDYSNAQQYYNKSIMLQPDFVSPYIYSSRMFLKWDGDTRNAKALLKNGQSNYESFITDSLIIETNILIDIYEGNYEQALKDLLLQKYNVFQTQFYYRPKYLYYANIYGLMNKSELEYAYYDSTRIFLDKKIKYFPDDPRLYSSLGIAYAGLGLDNKAINAGEKAVKLLPINKESWKGVVLREDLALIYEMIGNKTAAIEELKYLLSIPGNLSTKILELDPRWALLKNQPEFKKLLEKYSAN